MSTANQTVLTLREGLFERLTIPSAATEVMPGVLWGRFDEFFTPAFWVARLWIDGAEAGHSNYTLGRSLSEEVAACLLGGYGMPAEMGLAAFTRLQERGLLRDQPSAEVLESALSEPLDVYGRLMRYRYPRQKARYLSAALRRLADEVPPTDDVSFRDWLTEFDGIGPKTASWVTRNYRHSDQVAILDVHIQRAGRLAGVFYACDRVDRHYRDMETRLVRFAVALGVRLSVLDSMIWGYMKRMSRDAMTPLAAA